jgi:hypothetical protein
MAKGVSADVGAFLIGLIGLGSLCGRRRRQQCMPIVRIRDFFSGLLRNKFTLRVNQAHLKVFRSGLDHSLIVETRPAVGDPEEGCHSRRPSRDDLGWRVCSGGEAAGASLKRQDRGRRLAGAPHRTVRC